MNGPEFIDHNGLRIFLEPGSGEGWATPAVVHFHVQYGLDEFPVRDSIVYSFEMEVDPSYPMTMGEPEARNTAMNFGRSHGLKHVKALIDLEWPHGREYKEVRDLDHIGDRLDPSTTGDELRARLLGAIKRVEQALALGYAQWPHLTVEGTACVLEVPEDRIERELIDMRLLRYTARPDHLPADLEGSLHSYGSITAEGMRFLDDRESRPVVSTVAAMFCDVVGSTALNRSFGDHRWRELMRRHHEGAKRIVEGRSGRLWSSSGDGLMATFPTGALSVHAGLDLAGSTPDEFEVRVGINLGDFMEPASRNDLVDQQSVLNIASRIEGVADPGEVLIAQAVMATAMVSDDSLRFEPVGHRELRDVTDPPCSYRVRRVE